MDGRLTHRRAMRPDDIVQAHICPLITTSKSSDPERIRLPEPCSVKLESGLRVEFKMSQNCRGSVTPHD